MEFDGPCPDIAHLLPTFIISPNIDGSEGVSIPPSNIFFKHDRITFLGIYALRRDNPLVNLGHTEGLNIITMYDTSYTLTS